MKRNHSTFKRSESPASDQPARGRDEMPQVDGGCLGKPDGDEPKLPPRTATIAPPTSSITPAPAFKDVPSMPHFLQLSERGIFTRWCYSCIELTLD